MRYLGIDYGTKRVGVSISDKTNTIANPLITLNVKSIDELVNDIKLLVYDNNITTIVLGYPLNLDGSISDRCREVESFKKLLEELNVEIILEDERLTTSLVESMLIDNNTKRKTRKKVIDKLSACIILQGYLEKRGGRKYGE